MVLSQIAMIGYQAAYCGFKGDFKHLCYAHNSQHKGKTHKIDDAIDNKLISSITSLC